MPCNFYCLNNIHYARDIAGKMPDLNIRILKGFFKKNDYRTIPNFHAMANWYT